MTNNSSYGSRAGSWTLGLLLLAAGIFVCLLAGPMTAVQIMDVYKYSFNPLLHSQVRFEIPRLFMTSAWLLAGVCMTWAGIRLRRGNMPAYIQAESQRKSVLRIGYLPAGEQRRKSATFLLIALNILVFIAMLHSGIPLMDPTAQDGLRWGADFGPYTFHGQWWRLITSTFVHFGLLHILFNMWALFNVGRWAESIFGSTVFLTMYLVSGIVASLSSLYWHPQIVSAGASGAIFGVMGMLAGFFALNQGRLKTAGLHQSRNSIMLFILNNLRGSASPHVDAAAHIGGLAAGLLLGVLYAQFGSVPQWLREPSAATGSEVPAPAQL